MEVQAVVDSRQNTPVGKSGQSCPRCGEPDGSLPPVEVFSMDRVHVRRCGRCGARYSPGEEDLRFLLTCDRCGIQYLARGGAGDGDRACADCLEGRPPVDLPGTTLAEAMEREIKSGLSERWRFVSSPRMADYLDRLANQVLRHMEGAADLEGRIALVDDWSVRTLALPSGLVILSLGTLDFLEDEAELAFVLAHEFAHAIAGDVTTRMVRLGYHAATRETEGPGGSAWAETVLDLVRLGYGRPREAEADRRALEVVLEMGYDPESVSRCLGRLRDRIRRGDPEMAEAAVSHPTPDERLRRLEKRLFGRARLGARVRVNREVFRRAVGRKALAAEMTRVTLEETPGGTRVPDTGRRPLSRAAWIGISIALLAAIILGLGILLST